MVEPWKRTSNYPVPRELFPLIRFDSLWNTNVKVQVFLNARNKNSSIPCVRTELFNRWISIICLFNSGYSALYIMNIGSMNSGEQQTPGHINYEVPLSAFRFSTHQFHVIRWLLIVFTLCKSDGHAAQTLLASCIYSYLFYNMLQLFIIYLSKWYF